MHIHALPKDDPEANNLLLFRDKLREDSEKIDIYNQFKQDLANKKTSRKDYRISKTDIVKKIISS